MFKNRVDAGKKLASLLLAYSSEKCIIYGLPRGGVPVAFEVAMALNKPLDIIIVKKIGAPGEDELALGAVTEGQPPFIYLNLDLMSSLGYREEALQPLIRKRINEILLLQRRFRGDKEIRKDSEATAIVVDDGIATGATVKAAVMWLKSISQRKIVVAVPVAQESVIEEVAEMADDVVCAQRVPVLYAVGGYYEDFTQTSNEEVESLLKKAQNDIMGRPAL